MNFPFKKIDTFTLMFGALVGITFSYTSFGAVPSTLNDTLDSLYVGVKSTDTNGAKFFTNPMSSVKNVIIDIASAGSNTASGMPFGLNILTNNRGIAVNGASVGISARNAKSTTSSIYGRSGAVGKAVSSASTSTQAIGIVGYLEPTTTSVSSTTNPPSGTNNVNTDIPVYSPIADGTEYGFYSPVGTSKFNNIELGSNAIITSSDTPAINDNVSLLDTLDVNGVVTANNLQLDSNFYNPNAGLSTSNTSDQYIDNINVNTSSTALTNTFLNSTANSKMMFYVSTTEPACTGTGCDIEKIVTATCPSGTVRISCNGYLKNWNDSGDLKPALSDFRGAFPSSLGTPANNSCKASRNGNDSSEVVTVEALCMHQTAPVNLSSN